MKLFIYEAISAGLDVAAPPSMLAEGGAMLRAVAADFVRVADVSTLLCENDADLPGVRVLRTDRSSWRRHFHEAVARHDAVLLIAPECDGFLAERAQQVVKANRRSLGCTPAAIRATTDKLKLARHWGMRGVPALATTVATAQAPASFPVVVKPFDGAGSQGVRLIRDAETWARNASDFADGRHIVQPYHSGLPCSVAFLIGPKQTLPLVPCEQTLSDDGEFQYRGGRLPLAPDHAQRALKVATAAIQGISGLAGYVGVDLIIGEHGDDVAIEINPRLTTSYIGLRELCRENLAEAWLQLADGASDIHLSWQPGPINFTADGSSRRPAAPQQPACGFSGLFGSP